MIKCEICNFNFKNNSGGQLTNHITKIHFMNLEDYIVSTQYNNIAPRCICGYCNKRPQFARGKFKKFASGHNSFIYRETEYIKKYGFPKCKFCNNAKMNFHRGVPRSTCKKCISLNAPFRNQKTQEKVKATFKEKYNVTNPAHIPGVSKKISNSLRSLIRKPKIMSQEEIKNRSDASKRMWASEGFRENTIPKLTAGINTTKELLRRSEFQKNRMLNDKEYTNNILHSLKQRHSKLHIKIKNELGLENFGFISEQKVGRKIIDELHHVLKIAIEINGDYIHANPKIYDKNFIIKLPGQQYTAEFKWDKDKEKINFLEQNGYKVIVIWESDDLSYWLEELNNIFYNNKTIKYY